MTPADPAGGDSAGRTPEPPRRLAPPPPQYDPSDEISLEDPSIDIDEPDVATPRPTLRDSGPEPSSRPTRAGVRVGRPIRMLWMWIAPSSSAIGFVTGAGLFSFGMSVRQVIGAAIIGAVIASVLLVVGVLAGRDDGVPAEFASRASFGGIGHRIASVIVLLVRVVWGAVLLWLFAAVLAGLIGAPAAVPAFLAVAIVIGGGVAALGYRAVVLLQAGVAVLGSIAVVCVIVGSASRVDLPVAFGIGDGPAVLVLGGIVIVFSITALTLLPSASALGRYQGIGQTGETVATSLWSTLGTLVPALVIASWGAILAGGDPVEAGTLVSAPVDGLAVLVPEWARVVLIGAVGLGLLSALSITVYSAGFALQSVGLPIGRMSSALVAAVAIGGVAVWLTVASLDLVTVIRDLLPTLAVPVVAFSGVVGARLIRRRRADPGASDEPRVRWFELTVFTAAIVIGYGLTTATPTWLAWQGYLFAAAGVPVDGELAASDPGVLVAVLISGLAVLSTSGRARRPSRGGSHRVTSDRTRRAR